MSNTTNDEGVQAGYSKPAQFTIPKFEPLPPTSFLNRVINKTLAPLYYLLFSIMTAIIVVPVYTIIENIKHGGHSKSARRRAEAEHEPNTPKKNKATEFLSAWSGSYGTDRRTKES